MLVDVTFKDVTKSRDAMLNNLCLSGSGRPKFLLLHVHSYTQIFIIFVIFKEQLLEAGRFLSFADDRLTSRGDQAAIL